MSQVKKIFSKQLIIYLSMMLSLVISCAYADNSTQVAASCRNYLNEDYNTFVKQASANPAAAQQMASALNSCAQYNACSILNNEIPTCVATLTTRSFISNYYTVKLASAAAH